MKHIFKENVRGNPDWADFLAKLEGKVPNIPFWTPKSDNSEEIKHQSAFREGCLYIINEMRK